MQAILTLMSSLLGIDFSGMSRWDNWFLLIVGLFWLVFASIQDFKRREVENWWSFSLVIFVLAFRAFMSISESNYRFFVWGLIGLIAGFIIAELFYYARMFAGGDAKLLMALGAILPLSFDWKINLGIFILFIICIIIGGAIYGAIYSIILTILHLKDFKKEFNNQIRKNKRLIYAIEIIALIILILLILFKLYFITIFALVLFICPILLVYAKAIEESCMNRSVKPGELTVGDWLAKPLKINNRIIKPYWEGLGEKELAFIQKNYRKKVLVKYGIPFVPAFLLAFLLLILILMVF